MFHLCKWYCDLTTNDGTVLIGYWSQLRWGLLRLSHASYIFFRSDGSLRQRGTLFAGAGPQLCENEMNWSCQPLQLIGSWRARAQSVKQVLLEGHEGSVKWDCHMPTADVQIEFEGEILRGVGYVEQLTMTLPPWRLPFAELRWGPSHGGGPSRRLDRLVRRSGTTLELH